MKPLTLCLLLWCAAVQAEVHTEFYVQTTATNGNLNAGSTADNTPTFAVAGGNWTNATGVWFKSGAVTAAVTNGAWASVFVDGTATNTWFVGLITNVDAPNNRIWISQVAKAGTIPTDQIGTATIRVGGAWSGPNTNQNPSIQFPLIFAAGTLTNGAAIYPRVNLKSAIYSCSNAIVQSVAGPIVWQGYTNTPGDFGRATLDGTSPNAGFILLNPAVGSIVFKDITFCHNGVSGGADGVKVTVGQNQFIRCVFHDFRGIGLNCNSGSGAHVVECETYANGAGGFTDAGGVIYIRSWAHDNAGASTDGFSMGGDSVAYECVSVRNGRRGFNASGGMVTRIKCDSHSNIGSGFDSASASFSISYDENCNAISNTVSGFATSGTGGRLGSIWNCANGTGTQTNSSGGLAASIGSSGISTNQCFEYVANALPWAGVSTNNYSITLTAAKSVGRGSFTQTAAGSSGTFSYSDIGAGQSSSTNSAAAGGAYTFSQ